MGVEKHEELELKKLYPIIGATKYFISKVVLFFKRSEQHATILGLNQEYSDVFTEEDIKDIGSHQRKYFLIYKKTAMRL
jgi:hypothetical protein